MDEYAKGLIEKAEAEAERRAWLIEYCTRDGRELDELDRAFIETHVEDEEAFERLKEHDARPKECSIKHLYTLTAVDPYRDVELFGPQQNTASPKESEGVADNPKVKPPATEADDRDWPRQAEVAKRLGCERYEISRLVKSGELKTNGKAGHDCRVDPASVLAYCQRNGLAYNEQ